MDDLAIWQEIRGYSHDWHYRGLIGWLQRAGHRIIGRWAQAYLDRMVVDVGCGQGAHLKYSGNHYGHYVGLDDDLDSLYELRRRHPGTTVVVGDAAALPFASEVVECVISVYCLEHVQALDTVLSEMERILKPGGVLLVGLPVEGGLAVRLGRRLTSQRHFGRRFGIDWQALVAQEHCHNFGQVVTRLRQRFAVGRCLFIPFFFAPLVAINAIGCLKGRRHGC